jgi:murein DD-endopeptidase MepM/ murein hydrolase activator NlpD
MAFPLAKLGKLIGFPHTGTHTLGNWQSDNAVDIAVPVGTPMVAMEDGVVTKVTRHPQGAGRFAGDQITITAGGQSYFYAHGISSVRPGQRVKAGQVLGTSGSANGVAHLHFAVMKGNPQTALGKVGKGLFTTDPKVLAGAPKVPGGGSDAQTGGVSGAGPQSLDEASKIAGALVDKLWSSASQDASKAGLYVVLVGGGVFLLVAGIARATGAHPARAAASAATAVIPEARAARAVAA